MINLRYHIVSLTAVFLAIGIGLTLGSTFLDRATVENLQGQLENLDTRLADREAEIQELEDRLEENQALQEALDEQGTGLLTDRLAGVPVAVMASQGVDETDVDASLQALEAAGAEVQGTWWLTDRWLLDDDSEVDDLATAVGSTATEPARLRRMALDQLGGELRARQLLEDAGASDPTEPTEPTAGDESSAVPDTGAEPETVPVVAALTEAGFIDFQEATDGPAEPRFPDGTRIVFVGGSEQVPDDLVMVPLVTRMSRGSTVPILGVASSAMTEPGAISDLVVFVRQDEMLREVLPTVDDLEHFEGWAATVVALQDVGDGVVGHYGLAEDATRLLPPIDAP
jgi:hypothetical protein